MRRAAGCSLYGLPSVISYVPLMDGELAGTTFRPLRLHRICIMVRVLGPTEYKVVARLIRARKRVPPLIVIATAPNGAVVLEAVKVLPRKDEPCRKVGVPANLDSSCARRPRVAAGRDEETGFQ